VLIDHTCCSAWTLRGFVLALAVPLACSTWLQRASHALLALGVDHCLGMGLGSCSRPIPRVLRRSAAGRSRRIRPSSSVMAPAGRSAGLGSAAEPPLRRWG